MGFFIENANAETTTSTSVATTPLNAADAAPEGELMRMVIPFVFIFIVFYFLLIRPQQKKMKQHHAMVAGIRRGDSVITAGGIIGKVSKVEAEDNILNVEVADGVVIKVIATTVSSVVSAEKPTNDNAKSNKKDK